MPFLRKKRLIFLQAYTIFCADTYLCNVNWYAFSLFLGIFTVLSHSISNSMVEVDFVSLQINNCVLLTTNFS